MSSSFKWDDYPSLNADQKTESSTSQSSQNVSFDWSAYQSLPNTEQIQKKPQSFGEDLLEAGVEAGKGLARIGGRGGASLLAAPSKAIGGLLGAASLMYPEEEGLRGLPRRGLEKAGQYFKETGKGGQAYLNEKLQDALGESYGSGEENLAQFTEKAADIFGRGPLKGMGAPALSGAALGQVGKMLGAPPEVQEWLELAGVMGKDVGKAIPSLIPKAVKEKSGLVLPKIVEKTKDGLKYITPRVFSGKKEKVYESVSNQAIEALKGIQREALPLTKQIEEGIDVEGRLFQQLDEVGNIAGQLPNKIESSLISDYLDKTESKILQTPVPSTEQEGILKLIGKYRKEFGNQGGASRFYSPKQYVDQFRTINKGDIKNLYEKKWVEGEKLETLGFYRGLNEEIAKTIEHGTPAEFSQLFRSTNKEFSELQNINQFEKTLELVSKDGVLDASKLKSTLKNPKKAKMLKKQLGKDGFERLTNISSDLSKVKDKLGLVEEFGVKDMVKSGLTSSILTKLGIPLALPIQATKKLAETARGYMLLNPKGFRDTQNFLKALQSGSKKAIQTYLLKLDKGAKEFEDTLISPDDVDSTETEKGS